MSSEISTSVLQVSMDPLATDTCGRQVKLTREKIRRVLNHPCEGSAHVYAHEALVVIHRIKDDKNAWSVTVEELYDNETEGVPLVSIYNVLYKDTEIDAAIELFLSLIKTPRKDFLQQIHKKLGKWVILSTLPRIIPPGSDAQKYIYDIFRESIRRSLSKRRRSKRPTYR